MNTSVVKTSITSRLILLSSTLLIVGIVVLRRISVGEFNFNIDETVHACTGMYVADFIRAFPLTHPIKFTLVYYTHYPSLGLIHWPPFFYIPEGMAFLFGGFSVVAARVTILLFTLVGCYFWFRTIELFENPYTAAISTVVLAMLPFILVYEKTVMLEVPSLALCIAASYYWVRYLKSSEKRDLSLCVALSIAALLTKQTDVYLALFFVLTIVSERKWNLLRNRSIWTGVALSLLLIAPFYVVAFRIHGKAIQYDTLQTPQTGNPLAYYFRELPGQLGWLILCLSLFGILTSTWWGKWTTTRIMLLWIVACYLTMTAFAVKQPRYTIYWIPPFVYFAVGPFASLRLPRFGRLVGATASAFLLAYFIVSAWKYERPFISGYAEAAEDVTKKMDSGFLLFDGDLPGNFIFFVRRFDPNRRFVVLRKSLHTTRLLKGEGSIEFVKSQEDLKRLIDLYGIRLAIVDNSRIEFESQQLLRDYLQSPRFKLISIVPIKTNDSLMQGRKLFIYENMRLTDCEAKLVHTEMMSLSFSIDITPKDLGLNCSLQEVHAQ